MLLFKVPGFFFLFFISICSSSLLNAQCSATISTYPYTEDFETGMDNWVAGGTSTDWAWGAPSKGVISGAGSGSKCWVSGGLTTSFYNYGERSYVQSPCFDFTNLQHPYIVFKIFWETEKTYDGANLQYSASGGNTWFNLGTTTDPVNCLNANWYNESNISGLSGLANPKQGWAGNIQSTSGSCQGGNGSGGWITASHCVAFLAGEPQVMFRFTFGAGTQCNNFDGVAFDSVSIGEAPPNGGDFTYTCTNGNTVFFFTGTTTECPDNILWNFGDPASGAANSVTTSLNPTHTFSAPGSYLVSLNLSGPCNAPAVITKTIDVLNVTAASTNICFGDSFGAIDLTVNGGTGPYSYSWGDGATTQNRTALATGNYTVTITGPQACPVDLSETIIQATSSVNANTTATDDSCYRSIGTIALNVTGGAAPYTYRWSGGAASQNLNGVPAGNYTVTITDNSNCTASATAMVIGIDSSGCIPKDTLVTLTEHDIFIPNAFTPNGDGNNDFFEMFGNKAGMVFWEITVFDRWGEKVFQSNDLNFKWNGTYKGRLLDPTVLSYVAKVAFIDGHTRNNIRGSFTLIR